MNAHEAVEEIVEKKEYNESKARLIELAQEDINRFIMSCQTRGFEIGIKVGFFAGIFVSLFIFLLWKQ